MSEIDTHDLTAMSEIDAHDKFFEDISHIGYYLKHNPMKIRELNQLYQKGQLVFDTEYQRTEVWPRTKNRLLIDSIIRKYDISMIFLRQQINDGKLVYECIDGQQRLRCIFRYINNEFAIVPDVTPGLERKYYYYQLPKDIQSDFLTFDINSITVSDADDDTTTDIFMRLQEGISLNEAERVNALRSKMRKAAIELAKHSFFTNIALRDYRFAHRHCAAQILALTEAPESSELGFRHMKRIFEIYKDNFPNSLQEKARRSLTLLNTLLGSQVHAIKSKSDILILHLIAYQLLPGYSIKGYEKEIGNFIIRFIGKVESLYKSANERSKDPYIRYAQFRKWSNKRIQDKYKIMAAELLLAMPNMKPKDPHRNFNEAERYAVYLAAKGKCASCGLITKFADGDVDHIILHAKGGPTSVTNGRWMHRSCHQKSHGGKRRME
jgi:5-methylcytosine-specific restriction endonuclease McrA